MISFLTSTYRDLWSPPAVGTGQLIRSSDYLVVSVTGEGYDIAVIVVRLDRVIDAILNVWRR